MKLPTAIDQDALDFAGALVKNTMAHDCHREIIEEYTVDDDGNVPGLSIGHYTIYKSASSMFSGGPEIKGWFLDECFDGNGPTVELEERHLTLVNAITAAVKKEAEFVIEMECMSLCTPEEEDPEEQIDG